jgi:regulator of RNase E activity RraA
MRACGPAVTLRYVGVHGEPAVHRAAAAKVLAGDRDLYGVAAAGDVAVIDCGGVRSAAVMGELSALWARKAGVAGCVVDGAVRDGNGIIATGLPVWSRSRVPLAARHRVEAVAINDVVGLAGAPVHPGDYVVADDDGVCIVPFAAFPDVVERCSDGQQAEQALVAAITESDDLPGLVRRVRSTTVAD